ncbi:Three-deoxy-D-manno-octulosonic-acid transferase domain protein [Chthoniobacter flavus Ellin428]|uniref:3-deoxy-D-manno-octulosonic acid transferase n=1 Tax=Chthoniobacter flavus Ellin428 TaxID=497964 RepID=B4D2P4_9BACT|nr:glycosyltransferase N-terminal domain-containing protein [Chthoniobacter flavus]EDY19484.1 Three-deoxy-D-manno-octulosonic-acid transferase domain protein [Chthoniobacter flavus Ellin428]TCO90390.1 3-deoxy-D-manno-octulosonic-acid transferase [Chthoniobacter flavus]
MAAPFPDDARRSLRLYNFFFPFVFVVLLPGYLLRMMRRGGYRENFGHRFGRYSDADRQRFAKGAWLWLHSISVGETLLALKLARQMRAVDPNTNIALSVTTSTGFAVAREAAGDWLEVIYNPLDLLSFVRAALGVVRPKRLIFIEAVWPNLLAEAKRRGLPVAFVPRLSPRSERRFRRFRGIAGPMFRLVDVLAVQDQEDVTRWESLGVDRARIQVTGNTKFDYAGGGGERVAEFRGLLRQLGVAENAPILLAGSTFPGEELILAKVYRELRGRFPNLFLILVPRHVERTPEVLADLRPLDLRVELRSEPAKAPADVLVVNTTGELRDWYHLATVVFIGKSLTAHGGQNPVEPVMAGKPVVYGPNMENFAAIVTRWREEQAAVQVRDATELQEQIAELLTDAPRRDALARRAREIVAAHLGATERTVAAVLSTPARFPSVSS